MLWASGMFFKCLNCWWHFGPICLCRRFSCYCWLASKANGTVTLAQSKLFVCASVATPEKQSIWSASHESPKCYPGSSCRTSSNSVCLVADLDFILGEWRRTVVDFLRQRIVVDERAQMVSCPRLVRSIASPILPLCQVRVTSHYSTRCILNRTDQRIVWGKKSSREAGKIKQHKKVDGGVIVWTWYHAIGKSLCQSYCVRGESVHSIGLSQ